jgi:hypothetical protein
VMCQSSHPREKDAASGVSTGADQSELACAVDSAAADLL